MLGGYCASAVASARFPRMRQPRRPTRCHTTPRPPSTARPRRAADSVNSAAASEMAQGLDVFEKHAAGETAKFAMD